MFKGLIILKGLKTKSGKEKPYFSYERTFSLDHPQIIY